MDYRDRHVIVTGGTGALGTAMVGALLEAGAVCHVPYIDQAEADRFAFRNRAEVKLVPGIDLTQEAAIAKLYGSVPKLWASIHIAGGFAMAGPPVPTYPPEPVTTNTPPGTQNKFDETYNVCRGTDPRCYHPWFDPNRPNKILLYTRTSGPRHANLGPALAAGLNPPLTSANVVHNAIISWMGAVGVAVDYTEDAEIGRAHV